MNKNAIYIKEQREEEMIESDRKENNALDVKTKDENEIKEQKEIADMYNKPDFLGLGCIMQDYQQVIDEKVNKNKEDEFNIFNRNDEEDKKSQCVSCMKCYEVEN